MPAEITPHYTVMVPGKRREGRPVYKFYGAGDYRGRGVFLRLGWDIQVHMPEGFESDLASRPTPNSKGVFLKLVGVLLMPVPDSWWARAAVSSGFHDVLCEHPDVPRPVADGLFWAAMHVEGTPRVWRDALFRAVTFSNSKEAHNDPSIFEPQQPELFPAGHDDALPAGPLQRLLHAWNRHRLPAEPAGL